jgi:transposase
VSKGRDDKKFLSALHYFVVHNIAWRALPAEFGNWNSIWKRFWRLSQSGVFQAFFEALAAMSDTPHLVQMFDSTVGARPRLGCQRKRGQDGQACAVAAGRSTDVAGHTHHRLKSIGLISFCIRM